MWGSGIIAHIGATATPPPPPGQADTHGAYMNKMDISASRSMRGPHGHGSLAVGKANVSQADSAELATCSRNGVCEGFLGQ